MNVVGYFRSELGTGEAARQVVHALDARVCRCCRSTGHDSPSAARVMCSPIRTTPRAHFPVNLICMNADMLARVRRPGGPGVLRQALLDRPWFWEVERFPQRWTGRSTTSTRCGSRRST